MNRRDEAEALGQGGPEALGVLSAWMAEATAQRQLPDPNLSIDPGQSPNAASSAMYVRALHSRLMSLGYLPRADLKDAIDAELQAAVSRFQREAAVEVTATSPWAGPRTKQRLQQLVAFEEGQDLREWGPLVDRPQDHPAVARALYLRLHTLGFIDARLPLGPDTVCDPARNDAFEHGLRGFIAFAAALGRLDPSTPVGVHAEVLRALFEHDELVAALATRPAVVADPAHAVPVDALGRVELWLAGYDVPIGRSTATTGTPADGAAASVAAALRDFQARFLGDGGHTAPQRFTQAFFAAVSAGVADHEDAEDSLVQSRILELAGTEYPSLIRKLGSIASRLWDGLKRAWAWLKAGIRRLITGIQDELWNVARVVARSARESYELVLKAIDVVHRGVVVVKSRILPGSDAANAAVRCRPDFDVDLFLNAAPQDPDAATRLAAQDRQDAEHLALACRVLGLLLQAAGTVRRAVRAVLFVPPGWFVLLVALTRAVRSIKKIGAELRRVDLGAESVYLNPVR